MTMFVVRCILALKFIILDTWIYNDTCWAALPPGLPEYTWNVLPLDPLLECRQLYKPRCNLTLFRPKILARELQHPRDRS